jgi:hypothetical protein
MPGFLFLTTRVSALVVAVVAIGALAIEAVVATEVFQGDLWAALRRSSAYFTVLTNLLVALHFLAIAAGWRISGARVAGMVLWIGLVAAIYHIVLARLWSPVGLAWWSDQGLHTLVPVLVTLWWLAFASSWRPDSRAVMKWMIWPLAYVVYAALRGVLTGYWPYPFLDPAPTGVFGMLVNLFGLTLVFLLAGSGIAAFDHWRFGHARRQSSGTVSTR